MKKSVLAVFLLAGGICSLFAQDIITLTNGDEIKAKVIEISSTEIRYKRFENPDGPTIVVQRSEVFAINYENGTREVINAISPGGGAAYQREQAADDVPKGWNPKKPTFGLYVNPAGFITFGPIAGFSLKTSNVITNLHVRIPQFGFLMPYLDQIESNYTNSVKSGIGIGLGVNYYANNPGGGFYIGAMFEYWMTKFSHKNSNNGLNDWYSDTTGIVYCMNIGYRWTFSPGFFLNLGGYIGATTNTSYKWRYYRQPGGSDSGGTTYLFGMVDLAFGFNFIK